MTLDLFMRYTHSGVRWLVVAATLVAIIWLIYALVSKRSYDKMSTRIMTIFSSVVGLQWLIGLVFFLYLGFTSDFGVRYRWEHLVTMTLVLFVAHVHMMLKKRADRTRYIGGLVSVIVALLLVYVGVAVLPQGWGF